MELKPWGNTVLIELLDKPTTDVYKKKGSLFVPTTVESTPWLRGKVVSLGFGSWEGGQRYKFRVHVGQIVSFIKGSVRHQYNGHVIVHDTDILYVETEE